MSPRARRGGLSSRIRRAFLPLLVTVLFSALLDRNEALEQAALDLQARIRSPRTDPRVLVVRIDDEDYAHHFGGRSPLDPAVVQRVVQAIARGKPAVIGVDLDTSDPVYAVVPEAVEGVPVVWARDAPCKNAQGIFVADCIGARLDPAAAAGRSDPGARAGIAVLQPDADGTLRTYERRTSTTRGSLPSFATVLIQRYRGPAPEDRASSRMITYRPPTSAAAVTASWVLAASTSRGYQAEDGVFRGKIVLLGGSYYQARDWYPTPVGWMPGVDIWAQIAETELEGGGTVPPNPWRLGLVQFLAGLGVVALFYYLPLGRALWLAVLALPLTAALGSLLAFGNAWYLIYFIPVLGLLLIQQLYDEAKAFRDAAMLVPRTEPDARRSAVREEGRIATWFRARLGTLVRPASPAPDTPEIEKKES